MPRKPKPKVTAWSFSRWTKWATCPLQFKLSTIDRLPEEKGPALVRGQEVHNEAEEYVKAARKPRMVPASLETFTDEFVELRDLKRAAGVEVLPENELAFDRNWAPTSWFDRRTWVRIKIDALVRFVGKRRTRVIDYKTGRLKEQSEYDEQVELYALAAFDADPELQTVQTELWFLDHGVLYENDHDRDDADGIRAKWEERVTPMMADRRFDPTPGNHCRWCSFSKAKGGPCRY